MGSWQEVTRRSACPACGKHDWCAWSPDGRRLRCMRTGTAPAGMTKMSTDRNGGTIYIFEGDRQDDPLRGPKPRPQRPRKDTDPAPPSAQTVDLTATMDRLREQLDAAADDSSLAALASATNIPATAWAQLRPGLAHADDLKQLRAGGAGWSDDPPAWAWAFAEFDGAGRLVGITLRAADGRKGCAAGRVGAKRGLIVGPAGAPDLPVLAVEGASDVAACTALGLSAVGRPSNTGGSDDLAHQLDGLDVLVVGEHDRKDGGAWPGRDGARAVAQRLAAAWAEEVCWTLPPHNAKDVRHYLQNVIEGGVANDDVEALHRAGRELVDALKENARPAKIEHKSTADRLVEIALERYRFGLGDDGETFAVVRNGPNVALRLRGGQLRPALAKTYRELFGKAPSSNALTDAVATLEGIALDNEPEPVALRTAEHPDGDGVVVDLGDNTGRAIVVTPSGWKVVGTSPILFRRVPGLTGELPEPADVPGDLSRLRELLNVSDDSWPLIVGWIVAAVMPEPPHPILMLGGEAGVGKTTAARLICGLVDPSPAPTQSEPRDVEQWCHAASGRWAVCIDNVSRISPSWSDSLCKCVTGDSLVKRRLYTDNDVAVVTFKRCVCLTSIDAGALRGDLGSRLILVDLDRIADDGRLTEADLHKRYVELRPAMLAGLLTTVSRVLAELPNVELDRMPRMADFAKVLAALDCVAPELTAGGRALELFHHQADRIAHDVVAADPVANAIAELAKRCGGWSGTAAELLAAITPDDPKGLPRGWPKAPQQMGGRIKRCAPALRQLGINHLASRSKEGRRHQFVLQNDVIDVTVVTNPPDGVENADFDLFAGDNAGDNDDIASGSVVTVPASKTGPQRPESGFFGSGDNGDNDDNGLRDTLSRGGRRVVRI